MHGVHDDDRGIVERGEISPEGARALRRRRSDLYGANEIKGPVTGGKLSKKVLCSYAAPSFSTVPLTILISVYVVQHYEKLGASLAWIAMFQASLCFGGENARAREREAIIVYVCVCVCVCGGGFLKSGVFCCTSFLNGV